MTAHLRATRRTSRPAGAGIDVDRLSVSTLNGTPVIQEISFAIAPGEVMGLVGESGSGKSTAGLALLAHARKGLRIVSGSVFVDGLDMLALHGTALRHARGGLVSYVPQDPASGLNPALRVGVQLREALQVHPGSVPAGMTIDARVVELLTDVLLPSGRDLLRKYPHQLSGGQQQRVAIAMAFSCRPKLIVLDEPTTGLDVTTQRHVLDTVRALTERYEVSAVYVSHDLPVVAQIAHRTAVMYAGRIVENASSAELFARPRHPYTARLLRAAPSPLQGATLQGIEGRPPRPGHWPAGCAFAGRCDIAQDRCRNELPILAQVGTEHTSRCFFPMTELAITKNVIRGATATNARSIDGLSVANLDASYGSVQILYDVSLQVEAGQCTAVVGESGSGKTTLARCLAGLHPNWTGDVKMGDESLSAGFGQRRKDQRRKMQYIFQNPYGSLNPRLSVSENIEEPLRYFENIDRRARRVRVQQVLDDVALSDEYFDRMPDQLSGGERQRVAVGRALVVGPQILICDEITSALDVSVQALLIEQLRQLQVDSGLAMIFITHNLAVVRSIAQHVVVLENGRVVESGAVGEVLDAPRHPYTQQLLADLPKLPDAAA